MPHYTSTFSLWFLTRSYRKDHSWNSLYTEMITFIWIWKLFESLQCRRKSFVWYQKTCITDLFDQKFFYKNLPQVIVDSAPCYDDSQIYNLPIAYVKFCHLCTKSLVFFIAFTIEVRPKIIELIYRFLLQNPKKCVTYDKNNFLDLWGPQQNGVILFCPVWWVKQPIDYSAFNFCFLSIHWRCWRWLIAPHSILGKSICVTNLVLNLF